MKTANVIRTVILSLGMFAMTAAMADNLKVRDGFYKQKNTNGSSLVAATVSNHSLCITEPGQACTNVTVGITNCSEDVCVAPVQWVSPSDKTTKYGAIRYKQPSGSSWVTTSFMILLADQEMDFVKD